MSLSLLSVGLVPILNFLLNSGPYVGFFHIGPSLDSLDRMSQTLVNITMTTKRFESETKIIFGIKFALQTNRIPLQTVLSINLRKSVGFDSQFIFPKQFDHPNILRFFSNSQC